MAAYFSQTSSRTIAGIGDFGRCFDQLGDNNVDYVVGLRYDVERYFKTNSEDNNRYMYHAVSNNPQQAYFVYRTANESSGLVGAVTSGIFGNQGQILRGKLTRLDSVRYEYGNQTVLYNSTVWIYIGLTLLGVAMIVFVVKLIISEVEDMNGKRPRSQPEDTGTQQPAAQDAADEHASLNLPSSHSKIEVVNYGGVPEDGFIRNDNASSRVSGTYKYSNTEEFERQVSQINPPQPSGNVPNNNSAQDILSFVNQIPGSVHQGQISIVQPSGAPPSQS